MMKQMSHVTLPSAIPAERLEIEGRSGRLSYYVAGQGAPLLLLHSINAAGSAREVRPAFEHARHSRRVYAPDLPGYGFSDRSPRRYDIPLFCNAIHDMLAVIAADHGRQRVDALPVADAGDANGISAWLGQDARRGRYQSGGAWTSCRADVSVMAWRAVRRACKSHQHSLFPRAHVWLEGGGR